MNPRGTPSEPLILAMNDGNYRYLLTRRMSNGQRTICWVMLNPSVADESNDDPTMRRVIGFSQAGFDRLFVVNLYARRSPDPDFLTTIPEADAVGPNNDIAIAYAVRAADLVVVAWGASMATFSRWQQVYELIRCHYHRPIKCLGFTAVAGHPRHPLYVRKNTPFIDFVRPDGRPE